jgi:ABC-2 type transport system permease protein
VISRGRVSALVWKEWQELRRTRAALTPVIVLGVVLALPFVLTLAVPRLTGRPLEIDDLDRALALAERAWPELGGLDAAAAAQAFIFQQFLLLAVIIPVTCGVTLASHSLIGEKQARALEPLLATPLSTAELLVAKVLAAFAVAMGLAAAGIGLFLAAIGVIAAPGVLRALLTARTATLLLALAPAATLAGLQLTVLVSARVNDPRTAQQVGTLVVLPIVGVLMVQGVGLVWMGAPIVLGAAALLLIVWLWLWVLGVAAFDREQILTRWR